MGAYLHIGFVAKATTELPADISKGKLLNVIEDDYPDIAFDCTESDGKIMLTLKPVYFGLNFTTHFGGNFTTHFGGNFTTRFGGNFTTPEQACQG